MIIITIMADDLHHSHSANPTAPFHLSDFFQFHDYWIEDDPPFSAAAHISDHTFTYTGSTSTFLEGPINMLSGDTKEVRKKVAFKTKSEVEVLDDGFKWRKYGKKMVKNSPNPRNYYRCSVEGCPVKKRVERDKEDALYVVTTYEGIHNHQGPHQL